MMESKNAQKKNEINSFATTVSTVSDSQAQLQAVCYGMNSVLIIIVVVFITLVLLAKK